MASTDARPVPIKNTAYRVTFPILDADGDLVTGATGLDSEVSKDGGTFADCTNEATEIATSSGMYYLDLTSTEMNADCVAVIVKTSSSGAKTTPLVFYPQESGDIKVDVQSYGGTAGTFSGGRPEVNTSHIAGSAVSTSTAQIGVNVVNFGGSAGTFASGIPAVNAAQISGDSVAADNLENAFDDTAGPVPWMGIVDQGTAQSFSSTGCVIRAAASFADNTLRGNILAAYGSDQGYWQFRPITANTLSGDAVNVDAWDVTPSGATLSYKIFGAGPSSTSSPLAVNVTQIGGSAVTASGGIPEVKVQSIAANAITAAATAADFGAEIADAVWDEATSGHSTAGSTGKALTDASSAGDPWSTALPGAYGAGTAGNIIGNNLNATVSSRASQTSVDTIDDFLDTEIAAILADTNELQTDWANGGRLDLILDARASQTSVDTVDTVVDAIKAKTDSLTFTSAGKVDSNIKAVNNVTVNGTGAVGDEWGP